jgi:hypothetical protein
VPEKSLYERLGGFFAIAAVVDHFSDAVVKNPIVGQKSKNPQLREWHTKNLGRLPSLKFMRTLLVCNISVGPFLFTATKLGKTPLGLDEAHRDLRISPAEFDEVAAELGRTLASSRSRSPRRPKSWQPSPPTKTRSPQATSLPLSAARATRFLSRRCRPALAGRGVLDPCRRGDRIGMLFSAVHEYLVGGTKRTSRPNIADVRSWGLKQTWSGRRPTSPFDPVRSFARRVRHRAPLSKADDWVAA